MEQNLTKLIEAPYKDVYQYRRDTDERHWCNIDRAVEVYEIPQQE